MSALPRPRTGSRNPQPAQLALRLRPLHEAANDNGRPFRFEVAPATADRIVAIGVGVASILLLFAVAKGWL